MYTDATVPDDEIVSLCVLFAGGFQGVSFAGSFPGSGSQEYIVMFNISYSYLSPAPCLSKSNVRRKHSMQRQFDSRHPTNFQTYD